MLHFVLKGSELNPYCTTALGDEKHWCLPERMRADLRPVSPVFGGLSSGYQTTKKETHILNIPVSSMRTNSSCAKQSKCKAKKALPKYSSNVEVTLHLFLKMVTVKKAVDVF